MFRPTRPAARLVLTAIASALALASSWLFTSATAQAPLTVVTTTSILADLTRNVTGDRASVTSLLGPGADIHTFDPSPADLARVARAQVLVVNGAGLEAFLDDLLAAAGGRAHKIVASAGLIPLHFDDEHGHEKKPGHDHHHDAGDPHFWQDVSLAMHYVINIRDGLIAADPAGEAIYRRNAERYLAQLVELDHWVRGQVALIPAERRKLVTNHGAFNYFAARYGFKVVGTVFPGFSTARDPSPAEIAELVRRVREFAVPAVFAENVVNTRLAEQVAREARVQIVAALYSDALGGLRSGAETYITMIRSNVEAIVNALR